MNIDATCPQCGTLFTVRRELLGKRTKCTRCGTHFTITETPAAAAPRPTAPPQMSPPAPYPSVFADIPTHLSQPTRPTAPPHEPPAAPAYAAREFLGFEANESQPRFPAMRMVARGYQFAAIVVAVIAALLFLGFVITIIREPSNFLPALFAWGLAIVWALVTIVMLLFISQAIRLGLQIEQNTRETQQACRQLADHLGGIEVER